MSSPVSPSQPRHPPTSPVEVEVPWFLPRSQFASGCSMLSSPCPALATGKGTGNRGQLGAIEGLQPSGPHAAGALSAPRTPLQVARGAERWLLAGDVWWA